MTKKIVGSLVLLASSLCAGPIVQMHVLGTVTSPGFFIFDIDRVTRLTLCDQFSPGVTTEPYLAMLARLNDLTGTVLQKQGDPLALQKYQQVGILASLAYDNPALAGDVTRAIRFIVDGHGALTSAAQDLLDFVQTQNPANYSARLAQFIIFAPVIAPGFILETQEQVGYFVPEPATVVLIGAGLLFIGCVRRVRARAVQQ